MTFAEALKTGAVVLEGLDAIAKITKFGGGKAEEALIVARAAVETLRAGLDGKMTPQETLAQIEALHAELAGNDTAADKALREKFGGG